MIYIYYAFTLILVISSLLPLIQNQFWFFRIFDFAKVQIMILQVILFVVGFFIVLPQKIFLTIQLVLIACIIYEIALLYKYTPLYKLPKVSKSNRASESIDIISANVFQFNTEFQNFIQLIEQEKPDIFITMESNQAWDDAMKVLEKTYPHFVKVPLENTYGIHLYSLHPFTKQKVHYFIAEDIPSIQVTLKTKNGISYDVFAVHPPPPSPTEEATSKERDGELLAVAKKIREDQRIGVVIGDFNNVAWGKSSVLFRKTSEMIDPRIGRGLISTFHAKYKLLRFPIDQMYHDTSIFVEEIKALPNIGSDHLPLYCKFYIDPKNDAQEDEIETIEAGDLKEVDELIQAGKEEESDRETVVTE